MSRRYDYKEWQDRYDDLNEEGWQNANFPDDHPDKWDATMQRAHAENMRIASEQERYGREDARDEYGDDADEGHDERIAALQARELLLSLHTAHLDGGYEYTKPMQEVDDDLRRELEEENNRRWQQFEEEQEDHDEEHSEAHYEESSDMDLESDEETRGNIKK